MLSRIGLLVRRCAMGQVQTPACINIYFTSFIFSKKTKNAEQLLTIPVNNQIDYYVTNSHNDLPNLRTLVLKQNKIAVIFASAFSYASLKELDLSHNEIATIGKEAFAGTSASLWIWAFDGRWDEAWLWVYCWSPFVSKYIQVTLVCM